MRWARAEDKSEEVKDRVSLVQICRICMFGRCCEGVLQGLRAVLSSFERYAQLFSRTSGLLIMGGKEMPAFAETD